MKKRIFSAFVAGVSAAMFGVLYPEYILLPDTYQYIIMEKDCQVETAVERESRIAHKELDEMLFADPKQITVSSRVLQFLTDEGIGLWKDKNSDIKDMP